MSCECLGGKPVRIMKVTGWILHNRPTLIFGERFEYEQCWTDPKDGELCLSRVKSGETLMEARSGTDVQIVRQTWV